jgi:hypothetical protein
VRERRGSYSGFCCRLYPFICWIIIKEGPGNFSGGRSPHWVNHVNLCLSCIVCLLCFLFLHLFYFIAPRSCFSNKLLQKNNMVELLPMLKNEKVACDGCALGKMHKDEFPPNPDKKKRDVLDLVHTDVCGPMQTRSL